MAVPYPNCFQLPKVHSNFRLVSSSSGLCTRVNPVYACVKNFNPASHLESAVDPLLNSVKWDDKGLAVAIAQNVDTGAILMQGFVNREALLKTFSSRKATFYSRSRSTLWTKGETSMNFINVCDIFIDCDRDSIIYLGKPDGPTCHTGAETCYYTSVDEVVNDSQFDGGNKPALTTLYSLESTISKRKEELSGNTDGKSSWTKRLLLDEKLLCSKIREEADEFCQTLEANEDQSRTASEMADVLYHAMVLLSLKGVKVEDVLQVLRHRFAQSGIQEKNSRKSNAKARAIEHCRNPSWRPPSPPPLSMDLKYFDAARCKEALSSYDAVIRDLGKPNLVALDDFYRRELPDLLRQRNPNPHITAGELYRLMEWKLARGKWRPRLLSFISALDDAAVREASGKAFASLPDVSKAVQELTVLKGVGPATASAVLAAYAPELAPFMSDEALIVVTGDTKDYSLKRYVAFANKIQKKAKELSSSEDSFTPSDVERALWSCTIDAKLKTISPKSDELKLENKSIRKRKR